MQHLNVKTMISNIKIQNKYVSVYTYSSHLGSSTQKNAIAWLF